MGYHDREYRRRIKGGKEEDEKEKKKKTGRLD
jgi:hypothetical protein